MRYTPEELKAMAQSFIGMFDANVDMRPHMMLQVLCQIYNISAQEALDKIKQLAEYGACD